MKNKPPPQVLPRALSVPYTAPRDVYQHQGRSDHDRDRRPPSPAEHGGGAFAVGRTLPRHHISSVLALRGPASHHEHRQERAILVRGDRRDVEGK